MDQNPWLELDCPVCEHRFRSPIAIDCRIDKGQEALQASFLNPEYSSPSFLHLCTSCGFAGFQPDFSPLDPELQKTLKQILSALPQSEKSDNVAVRYRHAALIALYLGKTNLEIAELYLQASWCSDLLREQREARTRSQRKAREYFLKALELDEIRGEDQALVFYLLGKLEKSLGNLEKASSYFSRLTLSQELLEPLKHLAEEELRILKNEERP